MKLKLYVLILTMALVVISLSLQAGDLIRVPIGGEYKTEGVIIEKTQNEFRLRTHSGQEVQVIFSSSSDIQEKRKNIFRQPDHYTANDLILGLNLRVEGHGDSSGALLAEKIRFTRDELKVARTITSSAEMTEARIQDVENRMTGNQRRTQAELQKLTTKSSKLENQVEELGVASRLAREEAREADRKAEGALRRIEVAENRIADLDKYEEIAALEINFAFNSTDLTDSSKVDIDEAVNALSVMEGYLIEVIGFASSDGDAVYNKKLSQRRAEVVTNYLVEQHAIPLWRLVRPHGFGEMYPVGDNSTKQGREKNRRVEVRLLQSRGLAETAAVGSYEPHAGLETSWR